MIAAALLFMLSVQANDLPDAREHFEARQQDLIYLARKLGGLHRLNQLCPTSADPYEFRRRVRSLIEGERPFRATREAMIEAFNLEYQEASSRYFRCDRDTEAAIQREAYEALAVTERLSASMRGQFSPGTQL